MNLNTGDIVTIKEKDGINPGYNFYRVKVIKMLNSYIFSANILQYGFDPGRITVDGSLAYGHFSMRDIIGRCTG